ncbi:citrate lyase holo-[acyl-carrier protein] synthase [Natronincola ferrireducens]|uniref:citrate lyase holo-[acyl-carrier protein] synthase n=1 Tax=Natronincola ferrireducens TaxID=393762 RepID=A0A1G8Y376_9FIRM|nr:citrate lyase holo-[acyl-carrier protein] synthase [Natronincola ferrireducens]SDJ97288.1 holo-ACP synthase [Natronincola ferrireducens]
MNAILQDRENRYNETLSLINKYHLPVICGKINYPGNNKNTLEVEKSFNVLQGLLISTFKKNTIYTKVLSGEDGESILMVVDLSPLEAKKIGVALEIQHPLGRIFDIDVYGEDGRSIGREAIGMEGRRCILCNGDARICMRAKAHSLQEVLDCIHKKIRKYNDGGEKFV